MEFKEKALIILENLDKNGIISVDWNHEENLVNAIVKGLKEIEEKEQADEST